MWPPAQEAAVWLQTAASKQGEGWGYEGQRQPERLNLAAPSQEQVHPPAPLPSLLPAPPGKAKGCVEEMALLGQECSQGSIPVRTAGIGSESQAEGGRDGL